MSILKHWRDVLLGLNTLLIFVLAWQVLTVDSNPRKRGGQRQRAGQVQDVNVNMSKLTKKAAIQGSADAPVTVAFFNSLTCGFCNKVRPTLDQLMKKYPDKVKVAYMHATRNATDLRLAQMVECAGEQGKHWEMVDYIFKNRPRGQRPQPGTPPAQAQAAAQKQQAKMDSFVNSEAAASLGINVGQYGQCITTEKYAAKIKKDSQKGRKYGLRGTPFFIVNGKAFSGAMPLSNFEKVVEDVL